MYPAASVLTHILNINWCRLQFEGKLQVTGGRGRGGWGVGGPQSDHSSSSNSDESSSLSLHSTAIRRDRMAATSFPKWSLFSCSRWASTFRRLNPGKRERNKSESPRSSLTGSQWIHHQAVQCVYIWTFKRGKSDIKWLHFTLHPLSLSPPSSPCQ